MSKQRNKGRPRFKAGDTVRLKRGDLRPMRVESVTSKGYCVCSWLSGTHRHLEMFHEDELEKAEEIA